jgi:hypothetical protein
VTDEIRPPPLPAQPFGSARDEITQPGMGLDVEKLTLKRENMRLRQERNEARQQLTRALTESASGSTPPDLTRKQKAAKLGLSAATVTLLTGLVGVLVPIIERNWPAYAGIIKAIQQNLGLQ